MGRGRQVTDDELLEAAREVFLEHGPSASVALVAEKVGITGPAIFRRMGSKQNLMVRALTHGFGASFVGVLQSGPRAEVPVREQLGVIVRVLRQDIEALLPCLTTLRAAGMEPQVIAACFEALPPTPKKLLTMRLTAAGGTHDKVLARRAKKKLNTFLQAITRAKKLLGQCLEGKGVSLEAS